MPHAPQCSFVVAVFTSQPSSVAPGFGPPQSPQPLWQVCVHCPAAQLCALLWAFEHGLPQAPQLDVDVLVLVSQPSSAFFAAGRAQLPKPELQLDVHTPAAQVRWLTWVSLQAREQAPQWFASTARSASQPLGALSSQSP